MALVLPQLLTPVLFTFPSKGGLPTSPGLDWAWAARTSALKSRRCFLFPLQEQRKTVTGISGTLSRHRGPGNTRVSAVTRWQLQQGAATVHSFAGIPVPGTSLFRRCRPSSPRHRGSCRTEELQRLFSGTPEEPLSSVPCALNTLPHHARPARPPARQSPGTFAGNFRVICSHLKTRRVFPFIAHDSDRFSTFKTLFLGSIVHITLWAVSCISCSDLQNNIGTQLCFIREEEGDENQTA